VSNLPIELTDAQIELFFQKFGNIKFGFNLGMWRFPEMTAVCIIKAGLLLNIEPRKKLNLWLLKINVSLKTKRLIFR
jgi:hypothetical protein